MAKRRYVVVGAGIAGLSTALELARRGCTDITIIERGYPASGSSGLAVGIYNRQYLDELDLGIRVLGAQKLEDLERQGRLDITHNGFLRLARDESLLAEFEASVELQARLGGPGARVLDKRDLAELLPQLNLDGVYGGLFGPEDGYVDGHALCTTYVEEAESLGVTLRVRESVTSFDQRSGGSYLVSTDKAEYEADVVVLAPGAWAPRLTTELGFEIEVFPQRHEAFVFQLSEPVERVIPSVMDYTIGSDQPGLYFRGEGRQQLLAGLHTNIIDGADGFADPDDYFRGVVSEQVEEIASRLVHAIPSYETIGFHSGWAGLYPLSEDGQPVLGPVPGREGLMLACCLGGVGMQLGPASGHLLAEWILDGEPHSLPEVQRFTIERTAAWRARSERSGR